MKIGIMTGTHLADEDCIRSKASGWLAFVTDCINRFGVAIVRQCSGDERPVSPHVSDASSFGYYQSRASDKYRAIEGVYACDYASKANKSQAGERQQS